MKIAVEQIKPWVRLSVESVVPLYDTQADLQLLSKIRSQSYRAYISDLAKLPSTDISESLSSQDDVDITREETTLVASSLLPTQREIFLDYILPKLKEGDGPKYFEEVVELGPPIITFNNQFIIDGHHRWANIALLNPKARIKAINFKSEGLTPIQFLKLLQGAIILDKGELPTTPKGKYKVDLFHSSNKDILKCIDDTIPTDVFLYIKDTLKLANVERAQHYVGQNALSLKFNNLPAVGSPSRELMPQTNNADNVLDILQEEAPVLPGKADN